MVVLLFGKQNLAPPHHLKSFQSQSNLISSQITLAQHEKFIFNQYNKTSDITSKTRMYLIRGYVWLIRVSEVECQPEASWRRPPYCIPLQHPDECHHFRWSTGKAPANIGVSLRDHTPKKNAIFMDMSQKKGFVLTPSSNQPLQKIKKSFLLGRCPSGSKDIFSHLHCMLSIPRQLGKCFPAKIKSDK